MSDRVERLDHAERWFSDAFRVLDAAGGVALLQVDMHRARDAVSHLRARGIQATYVHVIVRAVALALARHPELHRIVAGGRRVHLERVDIGLSVAGSTTFAPVMVLEDAAGKPLPALIAEIARRVPEVQAKETQDLAFLRRWGWLVPFGFLRRWILRALFSRTSFRRQLAGTFQVSCLTGLDVVAPMLFCTSACLGAGRVRDAVVVVDGAPAVRPVVTLSCTIDHKAWDGVMTARFMSEVRRILQGGELVAEAGDDPTATDRASIEA